MIDYFMHSSLEGSTIIEKRCHILFFLALFVGNMAAACPTPPDSPSALEKPPFFTGELDSNMELYAMKCHEGRYIEVT